MGDVNFGDTVDNGMYTLESIFKGMEGDLKDLLQHSQDDEEDDDGGLVLDSINDIEEEDLDEEDDDEEEDEDFDFLSYGETITEMAEEYDDEELHIREDEEPKEIVNSDYELVSDRKYTDITDEVLDDFAKKYSKETQNCNSFIKAHFSTELLLELHKITMSFVDNNTKMLAIRRTLDQYGMEYHSLGGGTNRYAIMIDGYVVKIAYDSDGMIDNKREFIYSLKLQPYVVKTYEICPTGLLSICEYVTIFTLDDFFKYQNEMREILEEITKGYIVGDVGISSKNFVNWGLRDDGTCVILDYAYIYDVNYKTFLCTCKDEGLLYYDKDYVNFCCPECGRKFSFFQIRKKISRNDQKKEIGDVTKKGYICHNAQNKLKFNRNFVLGENERLEEIIIKSDKDIDRTIKEQKKEKQTFENSDGLTMEEIIAEIESGNYK